MNSAPVLAEAVIENRECPICEYPYARPGLRLKDRFLSVTADDFLLFHCRSCGLQFQDEAAVAHRLSEFYPPGYWWKSAGTGQRLERVYREWVLRNDQLRFLLQILSPPSAHTLLDIGCGPATLVRLARNAGFDAYGLEPSEEGAAVAEQEAPGRIVRGNEELLIEANRQFDVLTLFHVLEHIPDPFRYLKRLQKLLTKPGHLVVQVPNNSSLQARMLKARWYGLDCPRHLYNYSAFSLLHLLGRCGFRIRRTRHFSLRDNAAALVSSICPFLDPMSQRVKMYRRNGTAASRALLAKEGIYLGLVVSAQPLAWLEAAAGRGATITVHATLD